MVKGKLKKRLCKETILEMVSPYDIYRLYVGRDFKIGDTIHSPFREDSNPSFSIIATKTGNLHHMDYADTERRGDCFMFVEQLFFLDWKEALKKIDNDFGLGLYSNSKEKDYQKVISGYTKPVIEEKKETLIQVTSRRFDLSELAYWNNYHVSEKLLKENDVYAIKKLYINKKQIPLDNDLLFGYLLEDKWKLYWPTREKTRKWLSNIPIDKMSGLQNIKPDCNTAFITKSVKDQLVCQQIIPETCSVQNESTKAINQDNIKFFQDRCKRTIIGFDSDLPGIQACTHYNQYGFGYVNIPKDVFIGLGIKDFAGYAMKFGMKDLELFFRTKKVI